MRFVRWMNGATGRAARVAAGATLIVVGMFLGGVAGVVVAVVGLVPLVAGLTGVCLIAPLIHGSPRAH